VKICKRCNLEKDVSMFFSNVKRKDGLQTYCKDCQLEYQRKRYADPNEYTRRLMNREEYSKKRKDSSRKWYLKSVYNLTIEEYDRLYSKNNGKCWICDEKKSYFLHVDHDHSCCNSFKSCGKCIRGLLCHGCNSLLGHAKDNEKILKSAIMYLFH
jgi:hypothetical protein